MNEDLDASDFRSGNWLKKEDVPDAVLWTIRRVDSEMIEGERKLVMHFHESDRGLVMNNTNIDRAIACFDTSKVAAWAGKKIVLYVDDDVTFMGKRVGGLRIRAPKGAALAVPEEEVPF